MRTIEMVLVFASNWQPAHKNARADCLDKTTDCFDVAGLPPGAPSQCEHSLSDYLAEKNSKLALLTSWLRSQN